MWLSQFLLQRKIIAKFEIGNINNELTRILMNKEFHDMLFTRHSIRKYTDEPIDGEHVKLLLEAALLAPSGKSVRPWEFVVVEDKEVLAKMSECRPFGSGPVAKCKLAIVVCGDPGKTDVWVEDCTTAATYIQLQAEALGLGSCWISPASSRWSASLCLGTKMRCAARLTPTNCCGKKCISANSDFVTRQLAKLFR